MLENLVLVHEMNQEMAQPQGNLFHEGTGIQWRTCLRSISLGFLNPNEKIIKSTENTQVFVGPQAYEFLLEVVCGLHSPIVGETEVFGQFKKFVEENYRVPFKRIFTQILTDAKAIRQDLLRDMGSRSYGSLLRKHLKDTKHVTVLGSGQLAQEILPWLKNTQKVNVICRDKKKGQDLLGQFKFAEVNDMSQNCFGEVLIVAAKISTPELLDFISQRQEITKIIDLRETSTRDSLNLSVPTLTLKELFSEIKACEKSVLTKVTQAKNSINERSQKHFHAVELRPFGWEDLCG